MAASDYEVRASGALAPMAYLTDDVAHLDTEFVLTGIQLGVGIVVGMPALIDDEIVQVTAVELPSIAVLRGCGDTVPAAHSADARIWFLSSSIPTDIREYTATDTIGVKGLPYTTAGGTVPIANAPPISLTFNWRFFRPYAPGNFLIDGDPWFERTFRIAHDETQLELTWAHRDRIAQASTILGHIDASVGPEPGTTYTIRVYDDEDNLVRTVDGITDPSFDYTRVMAIADLPTRVGHLTLCSVRDEMESWQFYSAAIGYRIPGLGEVLGESLGDGE